MSWKALEWRRLDVVEFNFGVVKNSSSSQPQHQPLSATAATAATLLLLLSTTHNVTGVWPPPTKFHPAVREPDPGKIGTRPRRQNATRNRIPDRRRRRESRQNQVQHQGGAALESPAHAVSARRPREGAARGTAPSRGRQSGQQVPAPSTAVAGRVVPSSVEHREVRPHDETHAGAVEQFRGSSRS